MLNFYYMYSIIWGAILLLYSFGWSDLCAPLAPSLLIFFLITIGVSLILGYFNRKSFLYYEPEEFPKRNKYVTPFIVFFCLAEFVYCRQIPLIFIALGIKGYTEYTGIPTLHPLVLYFASFYSQYLFYRFLCIRDKKALKEYIIILFFIYFLQFNRGGLLISFLMSMLMLLAKNKSTNRSIMKPKTLLLSIILVLLILFGFGALGNIRHGFSFSNSSYIERLGRFNDSYPAWLPKQFMWAYVYIISPVANMNYNIELGAAQSNILGYLMTLLPDFIVRRIYAGPIYEPKLVMEHVFNATAGFGVAYTNEGYLGMYFLFFYMIIGLTILWHVVPIRKAYRMPSLAIMNAIVIFMFFTQTLYYSAVSFQLIFPLLSFFVIKVNWKKGKEVQTFF